jgi:hypothetical protein
MLSNWLTRGHTDGRTHLRDGGGFALDCNFTLKGHTMGFSGYLGLLIIIAWLLGDFD